MRVALVSGNDPFTTPYLEFYERCLDDAEYDFIFWNRAGQQPALPHARMLPFRWAGSSKVSKLLGYIGFVLFAAVQIRRGRYDRVAFLQTQFAVLLWPLLLGTRGKQDLVDIRDYSYEHLTPYRWLETQALKAASVRLISSPGYREFLPASAGEYQLVHNSHESLFHEALKIPFDAPVTISFIGSIRFYPQCKAFIDRFAPDARFRLKFIGAGAFGLREYCVDSELSNCEFIDRFPPEETLHHLLDCDLIFNAYGNETPLLDYALSNKLYYAAEVGRPIVTSPDTHMAKMAEDYSLGFSVDTDDPQAPERLWRQLQDFDVEAFERGRTNFLASVERDNAAATHVVTSFFRGTDGPGSTEEGTT